MSKAIDKAKAEIMELEITANHYRVGAHHTAEVFMEQTIKAFDAVIKAVEEQAARIKPSPTKR